MTMKHIPFALAGLTALMMPLTATADIAFVSNEKGNTVSVVDVATQEAIAEFKAGNPGAGV